MKKQLKRIHLKKSVFLEGFVVVYIVLLIAFFTSKEWFPKDGKLIQATPIGTTTTFADRDFTLKRWDYAPKQKMMELEFQILNHSTDGIENLYYEAVDRKEGKLKVEKIYEADNLTIIRINNVPEKFKEISFRIKLTHDAEEMLKYFTNKKAVNHVEEIKDHSEQQYLINREEMDIAECEAKIEENRNAIAEQETKINNANERINSLLGAKKYQTEEEQLNTDILIQQLEADIVAYQEAIADFDSEITEYEAKIEEHNKKIEEYKQGEQE